MRTILATILGAAAPAAAFFPGAGALCEALFTEDQAACGFVAQWDALHESFLLREGSGAFWLDPFELLDAATSPPPPLPSPALAGLRDQGDVGFAGAPACTPAAPPA